MRVVNIHQAKTHLSRLVKEVIITRAGQPVARLVPLQPPRRLGLLRGHLNVPEDFDVPRSQVL